MPPAAEDSPRANRGPAAGPENRRALIAAAREVYADFGLAVPLNAVARRAGVGQGSLYRHFPDRTALAVAVFEENVDELERLASPEQATLHDLLDLVVDQAVVSTAFIELMLAARHHEGVRHLSDRYLGVVSALLAREQAAGHVGMHIEPADVTMATGMLAAEIARTDPRDRRGAARRARALFRAAFAPR